MGTIGIVSLVSLLSLVFTPQTAFSFSLWLAESGARVEHKTEVNSASCCTCTLHQGSVPLKRHVPYESRIRAERITAGERADGRTHHFGRIPFPGFLSLFHRNETFPRHVYGRVLVYQSLDICAIWSFPNNNQTICKRSHSATNARGIFPVQ